MSTEREIASTRSTLVFVVAFVCFGAYQNAYSEFVYQQNIAQGIVGGLVLSVLSALLLFVLPRDLRNIFYGWRSDLIAGLLFAYTILISLYLRFAPQPPQVLFATNGYLLIGIEVIVISLTSVLIVTATKHRAFPDVYYAVVFTFVIFFVQLFFIAFVRTLFSFGGM